MIKIKIKKQTISQMLLILWLFFSACLFVPKQLKGQIRAGSGYLKMLHGARETGVVGTLTGALDYTYSFYANPAATGFLREWQLSATYTNWISDLYNASFIYGRNIRTPWSRWTRFALGINYLGIPEFNNADEQNLAVSGNNLLATASIGQPLSLLTRNLSIGANVKYFDSNLAGYDAKAVIFDIGLLFRTPRFDFLKPGNGAGLFDYLIFSSGVTISNLGAPITFLSEKTPLPRTVRAGAALNIGSHHGFQFNVGTDYRVVRDEDGFFTLGSELSWRQIVSVRVGYSWEKNLLGNFTFGSSLRFDDQIINNIIFSRNNALRLDLAANQNNNYFSAPYHGTITYQPLRPENFRLNSPFYGEQIDSDSVTLTWELTRDPDLYDDVDYWLVVDKDSTKLARLLHSAKQEKDSIFLFINKVLFLVKQQSQQTHFLMEQLTGGDYFWTVMAYDIDNHVRFAEINHRPIAKFHVTEAKLKVIAINFDYSPWITEDDYQGVLKFTISNIGDRIARNFSLSIYDSLAEQPGNLNTHPSETKTTQLQSQQPIAEIKPGEQKILELEWRTKQHGLHQIKTEIVKATGTEEIVNTNSATFYTIPKGIFVTNDTVVVQTHYNIIYDIPYIGKIYFDSSKTEVKERYIKEWVIEPPLALFAKRLKKNPTVKISLQGTIDPNSDEHDISLANNRAKAVIDTLLGLGVNPEQMEVLDGIKLSPRRLPRKSEDARWVLEERKCVIITTDESTEKTLFNPLQTMYIDKKNFPITFNANIIGVVPLLRGAVLLEADHIKESLNIEDAINGSNVVKNINWALFEHKDEKALSHWLDINTTYTLQLTDTLNRQFKVRPQKTYLNVKIIGRERRYYVLAKFATTEPYYNFYWTGLLDVIPFLLEEPKTRMRFAGHGCATGSNAINNRLSKKRSTDFQQKFLQDSRERYPGLYQEIKQRLDSSQGFGESQPFEIKSPAGQIILIGDNNKPLGRQLNRRVMIFFYTSQ